MARPRDTQTIVGSSVPLDLIKRAMVGARAAPRDKAWRNSELGRLADHLESAPSGPDFRGALHIRRNVRAYADLIDETVAADAEALIQDLDLESTDIHTALEELALHAEGDVSPVKRDGTQIFRIPAWVLIDRVQPGWGQFGKSLNTLQTFEVGAIGVRRLDRFRKAHHFGGRFVLHLERDGSEPDDGDRSGAGDRESTWKRIEARARDHWKRLHDALRNSRVYAVMQQIGRNDLRTALWLSETDENGEGQNLKFAEERPDLAAYLLPGPEQTGDWYSKEFHRDWATGIEEAQLTRHVAETATSCEAADEQVFLVPGWLLRKLTAEPLRHEEIFAGTQRFVVNSIGVRWVDAAGQDRQLPRGRLPPLVRWDENLGKHRSTVGGERAGVDTTGLDPDICGLAVTQPYDHWNDFVDAVHGTRAYAAMRSLLRDDLLAALVLSHREPNGEARRLQFAEKNPEVAAQMLSPPSKRFGWSPRKVDEMWKGVSTNRKLREITEKTWFGSQFDPRSVQGSSPEERIAAMDLVRGGRCVRDIGAVVDEGNTDFRDQNAFLDAWKEFDREGLHKLMWTQPLALRKAIKAATTLISCLNSPESWWIPASLLARAVRTSGVDATTRTNADVHEFYDWSDAARDLYTRSLKPQLAMAGHDVPSLGYEDDIQAILAAAWLVLRYGSPSEREAVAEKLPDAAQEARQRETAEPKWRDLPEWSDRWHVPARLALADTIATPGSRPETDADRLATPLVLEAGASLGPNERLIRTVTELKLLSNEEKHCISVFMRELRAGTVHCVVIWDADDERRRSTVLIEEFTQEVPFGRSLALLNRSPYRLKEIRMRRNAESPPEHRERAEQIVRDWCVLAAERGLVQASREETERRSAGMSEMAKSTIPLGRVQPYWDQVSAVCAPRWLHDFNPSQRLLVRLYRECIREAAREGESVDEFLTGRPFRRR